MTISPANDTARARVSAKPPPGGPANNRFLVALSYQASVSHVATIKRPNNAAN
ncbi:hypothetical protein VXL81_17390 [Phaeobacter sp. JH204B]|uniref:hypothetical protein n=1 Tax=unclassified Phaeobacter TaxID=2621772 RepID=UPI003A86B6DA